ncbi:MAG TPA: potassium-transporting ATPase subunit KdpA [Gaiellaceae bacterium]|nr:potassium-transporting ATPase subunit KdpA [Gaiellaceae bacterium]
MGQGIAQIAVFLGAVTLAAYPFGLYMARVFDDGYTFLARLERGFHRAIGNAGAQEQTWRQYGTTLLVFSLAFELVLYGIQRLQGHLFLNPEHLHGVASFISLNTSISFVTNTNWQYYAGESTMSYLTQMAGLAVQNFVSAAVGIAVMVALFRGFSRRSAQTVGNFWRDLYRALIHVLLPLAVVGAVILVAAGVPQTLHGYAHATTLQGAHQTIARGPVASQIAIKHVGTNGGGFYNSNSATPFEGPGSFGGYFELFLELLIPFASVFMFGRWVRGMRNAVAIFAAMFVLLVAGVAVNFVAEQHGSQVLRASGVSLVHDGSQTGGNMTDKETRFGIAETAVFTTGTSATSTGAVIAGHDAMTAVGGAVPLTNIFLGEIIFGGVGSGMYGILFIIVLAVFVAGLMVGRTPEYLGKKIEAREVKLAALGALFPAVLILTLTAAAMVTKAGLASVFNPGAHGFTEALYAYTSQAGNNGSAMAGYGATSFSAYLGGIDMLFGRFVPLIAALALAGALAAKKTVPASAGTFRSDGATFSLLLVGMIVLTAGLMLLPALSLGPIVEGLMH